MRRSVQETIEEWVGLDNKCADLPAAKGSETGIDVAVVASLDDLEPYPFRARRFLRVRCRTAKADRIGFRYKPR
jgi:hypothetical protein